MLYIARRKTSTTFIIKDEDTTFTGEYTLKELDYLKGTVGVKGTVDVSTIDTGQLLYISPYTRHIKYNDLIYSLTGLKLYIEDGYLVTINSYDYNDKCVTIRLSDYMKGLDFASMMRVNAPNVTLILDNKLDISTSYVGNWNKIRVDIRELDSHTKTKLQNIAYNVIQ